MSEKRYITMRHFDLRRKFIPLSTFDLCANWIDQQQKCSMDIATNIRQYNKTNIAEACTNMESKSHNDTNSYTELTRKFAAEATPPTAATSNEKKLMINKYSRLLAENVKNLKTLKTFLEVSLLEEPINELSQRIDNTVSKVVQQLHVNGNIVDDSYSTNSTTEGPLTNGCLHEFEGMRKSWAWIEELLKCLIVHVRHASAFCQFHHDLHTLLESCVHLRHTFTDRNQSYDDNYSTALRLSHEMQEAGRALKSLKSKVTEVTRAFQHVLPVHLRTQSSSSRTTSDSAVAGVVICRYVTKEVELKAGEEVAVVDRESLYMWKVRTLSGVYVTLPSIVVAIVGHDDESLQSLKQLHVCMEELINWTVDSFNEKLTKFLMKVFKKSYTDVEVNLIQTLSLKTKSEMVKFFDAIEKSSSPLFQRDLSQASHLNGKNEFNARELRRRLTSLRHLIQDSKHDRTGDIEFVNRESHMGRALVVQLTALYYLMESFESMRQQCRESMSGLHDLPKKEFKVKLDREQLDVADDILDVEEVLSRIDEIIFKSSFPRREWETVDNLEFLDHIKNLSNFVQDFEPLTASEGSERNKDSSISTRVIVFSKERTTANDEHGVVYHDDSTARPLSPQKLTISEVDQVDICSEVKTSEIEQFYAVQSEENKRFIIRSVVDPTTKKEISLSEALQRGVVSAASGSYLVDEDTGATMPIAAAMSQNLIKVQSTVVKKVSEKKSSVGLVTVKTTRDQWTRKDQRHPIEKVRDLSSGCFLTLEEARLSKIIDVERGLFLDTKSGKEYDIKSAEENNWIVRSQEPIQPPPDVVPETRKITYAVWGVLDRRLDRMLPFLDACREGLMDRDTAMYYDLLSRRKYSIEEALRRNLVEAEVVEDPRSINPWRGQ